MTNLRIYVASLADYNAGRLHGTWIDLDGREYEEIAEEVQGMLNGSREPVAEDWAIHDHEGFGKFRVGEYADLRTLALVGKVLAEQEVSEEGDDLALLYWLGESIQCGRIDLEDYDDDVDGLLERFREAYRGNWSSFQQFVHHDDATDMYLGIDTIVSAFDRYDERASTAAREALQRLQGYVDWELVARDMETEMDFDIERAPAPIYGVWIFETQE